MTYTYPSRDLDRPATLLGLLGSFWSETYDGVSVVASYATARGVLEQQVDQDVQEAVDSISRFKVPVYHTDLWYQLVIKESEMNRVTTSLTQYGADGYIYGPNTLSYTAQYGLPNTQGLFTFPLPGDLVRVPALFNRVRDPSFSMQSGFDYTVEPGSASIAFRVNPFENELVSKRNIYEGDVVVDREAALWAFHAQFDWRHIYVHHGHVLRMDLPSSPQSRDLMNAVWDGMIEGGHYTATAEVMAAVTDTPIVRNEVEVVEDIVKDALRLLIITDLEVYQYPLNATAIVAVGDTVYLSDQLVNTVEIIEFNQGVVPADLYAVTLGKDFLMDGYIDGITFRNLDVDTEVDVSGVFTDLRFEVGGFPGDVEKFWTDFQARGIAAGSTLAQLLDQRTNKSGEPSAAALPATINPLSFLAENVLRNNIFVIKVRPTRFGENALSLRQTRFLRRIIPPHTAYILIAQLDADDDDIIMDGPGTELRAGYTEEMIPYLASEVISESIDPADYVSEEVLIRYIDGVCI